MGQIRRSNSLVILGGETRGSQLWLRFVGHLKVHRVNMRIFLLFHDPKRYIQSSCEV